MDTITHGIAGALIGKAVFCGEDMFASGPVNRARIITWSLMIGAIFPDSDIFREMFSHNPLLILTWHRSITHSILCMPLFALALAALTWWFARWRKWEAPSFLALTGIYAVGILSHIFLDLCTSFGTMVWSPLRWTRPAWDLLFIIDVTFTALLFCPQMLAWVYRKPEGMKNRASITWSAFALASMGVAALLINVGAPISAQTAVVVVAVLAIFFLVPTVRGKGLRVRYVTWQRAGLAAAILYIGATFYAHRVAMQRVEKLISIFQVRAESFGALPLPPSLWHWDGLVNTSEGVFEVRLDLSEPISPASIEQTYFLDATPNQYTEAAKRLPAVQTVLWFSRFPVTRFHMEGKDAIVEFSDIRFHSIQGNRTPGFTYQVKMDASGKVLSQGWARN